MHVPRDRGFRKIEGNGIYVHLLACGEDLELLWHALRCFSTNGPVRKGVVG